MFAYILKARAPADDQAKEFFRRFKETPGLLHAFDLQGVDDSEDGVVVAVWESREAAERYLQGAPLRREVDEAYPTVTRTMYEVLDSK
jgi:heme-degrading monooxygenase HmoA